MAGRKPIEWMGSSLEDLAAMPDEVKSDMGYALHFAQMGKRHDDAKPPHPFPPAPGRGPLFRQLRFGERRLSVEEKQAKVVRGSGNVFADLGLPSSEEEALKADLATSIGDVIRKKGLTQAQAADILGESQPNVSMIVGGKLRPFSLERLMKHLTALGKDVELRIRDAPKSRTRGHFKVVGG